MLKWVVNKWVVMKWIEVWLAHWDGLLLLIVCQASYCTRETIQLAFNPPPRHLNSVISQILDYGILHLMSFLSLDFSMLTIAEDSTFTTIHSALDAVTCYKLSHDNLQLLLLFRLMVMNLLVQAVLLGLVWWIGSIAFGTTMKRSSWVVIITCVIFSYLQCFGRRRLLN